MFQLDFPAEETGVVPLTGQDIFEPSLVHEMPAEMQPRGPPQIVQKDR